jgi:hypothetical protein
MRRCVPRVIGGAPVAVMAGPTERKLDHMGLAHDDPELAAQRSHQRSVPFPAISWWPAARPGEAGIAGGGEQVLDRNEKALEGTDRYSGGKRRIGRLSGGAGLYRRPSRVGMQPLAETLVPANRRFGQFPGGHPFLAQIRRDLDQRTGEQIARHRHLLSGEPDRRSDCIRAAPTQPSYGLETKSL